MFFRVHVKKRVRFLQTILDYYWGDAFVSFEGDLSTGDFSDFPGVSYRPRLIFKLNKFRPRLLILKRNTLSSEFDIAILPLEEHTVEIIKKDILNHIGVRYKVIHIQIAKHGELVAGIYDNFHPDTVWVKEFPESVLEKMLEDKIIAAYTPVVR